MTSTGDRWRLGHRPALDGLRAIAVLMVLTTHLRIPGFALAPAVGVAAFFTLSGFLITSLLLERREPLSRFYARRAARLMPAMLACVLLWVGLQVALRGHVADWPMIVGALTYTLNWVMIANGYSPDSGIAHLWSLAIEEQFYLLWPLALLGLRRFPRRVTLGVTLGAALLSFFARAALGTTYGYNRAYHGFDTRADELLLGCALALFLHGRREQNRDSRLVAPLVVALFACSYISGVAADVLMPTCVAVLTVAIMFVAVNGDGPVWLTAPWLRWVGGRSYGVYLYHMPIRWAVEQFDTRWWVTAPIVLVLSFGSAAVSWRHIEQPMRRRLTARTREPAARLIPAGMAQTIP